ncbi:MAG: photosynthetic reaction center subunit M, partial [Pseudomonadota bacterium]
MADYQYIFTQTQVRGHFDPGVELPDGNWSREPVKIFSYVMGKIGDAQIGPMYLGFTGVAALICGSISILIMGLNMAASVDWNPF